MLETGGAFSPECDALLRELSLRVADMRLDQPVSSVLESPGWHEIVSMAKVALRKIERIPNGSDTSES